MSQSSAPQRDSSANATTGYSFASNLKYIFGNIWRWEKVLLPLAVINSFFKVLNPFIAIFMPKLVIDALTAAERDIASIATTISLFTVALLVSYVLVHVSDAMVQLAAMRNRGRYDELRNIKTMRTDYLNVESQDGQNARAKSALAIKGSTSGAGAIVSHMVTLMGHFLGLIIYSLVVSRLGIWAILGLILLSMLSFLAALRARRYEAAHADKIVEAHRKFIYAEHTNRDFRFAKDVRLYEMADWLVARIHRIIAEQMNWERRIRLRYFGADSVAALLGLARDGLAYVYLIGLVLQDAISVGDFTLYFAAIAGISSWLNQILHDLGLIDQASREVGYLRAYLDMPDRSFGEDAASFPVVPSPEIIFDHVTFRYPNSEKEILQDFCLTIKPGEKLALVGVNGAGKTTCTNLLLGLYEPTFGRILLNGRDIATVTREELFAWFAPVFQEVRVLAFDLQSNVSLRLPHETSNERVEDSLERAGLRTKVASLPLGLKTSLTRISDENGIELSGGETQKLMLARALYKDAPVIIMDEPTAALDPIAEAELYQSYNEMIGQKTSIYISHRLSSTRFCDRIAFLEESRIVELGSHDELMAQKGRYADLYAVQSQYYRKELLQKEGEPQK